MADQNSSSGPKWFEKKKEKEYAVPLGFVAHYLNFVMKGGKAHILMNDIHNLPSDKILNLYILQDLLVYNFY